MNGGHGSNFEPSFKVSKYCPDVSLIDKFKDGLIKSKAVKEPLVNEFYLLEDDFLKNHPKKSIELLKDCQDVRTDLDFCFKYIDFVIII